MLVSFRCLVGLYGDFSGVCVDCVLSFVAACAWFVVCFGFVLVWAI